MDFVLDELKKMESGSSNLVIDGHFMPYTRLVVSQRVLFKCIV